MLLCNDITNKPEKHIVVPELEKHFEELTFTKASHLLTSFKVHLMSVARHMPMSEVNKLFDLFNPSLCKIRKT